MDGRTISSQNPGNIPLADASNPMASVSGAHHEAEALSQTAVQRDAEVLRQVQAGDRAAYGQIVLAYQNRLYNAVLRLIGEPSEAAELTQEAFLRGLMKAETFRGQSSAYTWLFRIAVNLSLSELRKPRRKRVFSLDAASGNGDGHSQASALLDRLSAQRTDTPLESLERQERDQQVLAALGRLEPDARAVLVMCDIEGFDYQQMSEILDLPLGTLKSRIFRARLALRDELKSYMQ
jgi:RNA polymerase sigma-70 factor, ECF subfamily